MLNELGERLAVVLHDAGAANLAIGWLRDYGGQLQPCVAGPALTLWSRTFAHSKSLSLPAALEGAEILFSGTSWASDLEHVARRRARALGMRSIAVVDHWVNYRERFVREGETILPDELWVADEYAVAEARRSLPEVPVRQLPNIYLSDLVQQVLHHRPSPAATRPHTILYVLEPIRQCWRDDERSGELQAFDFFIERLRALHALDGTRIRLRPHPSDPAGKYSHWLQRYPELDLAIDGDTDLASQLAWADWVVGCESFALVIALHAGRIAASSLPPWAPTCRLPQAKLLHLRNMTALPA